MIRRALDLLARRPRTAAWTLVALVCTLTIAAVSLVVLANIDGWTSAPQTGGGSMVVYLGEGISDANARMLAADLQHVAGVDKAELVAPADAAKLLERALGADAALLDGVDLASLPPTVEVTLAPGVRDVIAMSPFVQALRGTPGVEDVIVEDGGAKPKSLAGVRDIVWTGAALLAGLALVTVFAAIRVRLERDRQEHAVLHLLGASPSFSALPAALAGALLGLCAALAASVIVGLVITRMDLAITAPALGAIGIFVAIATGLGMIGGGLAGVSRVAR
ncbi:MAG TPA: permease-like cell division protein FtsX [Kofleriaceae bacterium]